MAAVRLLEALLWSVAANEGWRWGTLLLNRVAGADFPVLFIGLPLLAVLSFRIALARRPARVAALADARIGLSDRLSSYLDFGSRDDVPGPMRQAQAAETAGRIGGVDLARAFPIGFRRALAVPLFALMLWFTYLNPFMPGGGIPGPPGGPSGRLAGTGPKEDVGAPELAARRTDPPPEGKPADAPRPGGGEAPDAADAAPPAITGTEQPAGARRSDAERAARSEAQRRRAAGMRGGKGPRTMKEPVRLVSETVGQSLTPVSERLVQAPPRAPGRVEPPPPGPRGLIALDLLPREMEAAGGLRGSGNVGSLETPTKIEIDFDAVPGEYRDYVRRYFVNLGLLDNGGRRGTGTTD